MKTKQTLTVLLLLGFALSLATIACDDGKNDNTNDDNEVKERTATRTLTGGIGSVTVKGNLTKPQLDDSADKIAVSINTRINKDKVDFGEQAAIDYYTGIIDRGVTYIVEATPAGYTNFKTTGDGKTIYIALNQVDSTHVGEALTYIYNNSEYVAKATPTANNKRSLT
jgi:hypothetical protein